MLRILLIEPSPARNQVYEALGLEMVAGALHSAFGQTVEVDLRSLQMDIPHRTGIKHYRDYNIVGISCTFGSLGTVTEIANEIQQYPKCERPYLVLGNLLATFASQDVLNICPDAICVVGEGEDAICAIARADLQDPDRDIETVKAVLQSEQAPNLVFMSDGKIIETKRKLVDLSTCAPPARDFLSPVIERHGMVRIEGSRGCSWGQCSFCAITSKYGFRGWRPFPIKRIIDQLEVVSKAGARNPYFTDEDFAGSDPDRMLRFAEALFEAREEGRISKDLRFYIELPLGSIIPPNTAERDDAICLLNHLKEVGLREVFMGVESGSERQLRRYRKKATAPRNIQALEILRQLGVDVDVGFIMFDPEANLEDLKENIEFIKRAKLVDHGARGTKAMRLEPGTDLASRMICSGIATPNLKVDDLTYPYRFVVPAVQAVHDAFATWEQPSLQLLWSIEAYARGEVSSQNRARIMALLGKFRCVEFDALSRLVALAEDSWKTVQKDADKILEECTHQRQLLVSEWQSMKIT